MLFDRGDEGFWDDTDEGVFLKMNNYSFTFVGKGEEESEEDRKFSTSDDKY